jgi:ATP-binding cassette subfamily C protein CydC
MTSFEAVLPLSQAALNLESNLAAAGRLLEIVDAPPQVIDPIEPVPPPETADIQVRGLSFRYPVPEPAIEGPSASTYARQLPYALQDLSLCLRPGMRLAIVGLSGAGKSTLVKLLLRFWDFDGGEIDFGGQDIRAYKAEDVRHQLAVVEQNPYLFNSTIRENLLVANPAAGDDDLVLAARQARIYDFIQLQPHGFNTLVGEDGLRLSGGERQRLAIARAL